MAFIVMGVGALFSGTAFFLGVEGAGCPTSSIFVGGKSCVIRMNCIVKGGGYGLFLVK